ATPSPPVVPCVRLPSLVVPPSYCDSLISFLPCYHDHPDLHSFPTRRSSDLSQCARTPTGGHTEIATNLANLDELHLTEAIGTLRSEEHTSELQSRFDLVCRLLLEKKKKKTEH